MTVSNGIGGGLILNGKPFQGHFGNAAEIGHCCIVEQNGFPCRCGNIGCLEAEAAGPGMVERYRRLLKRPLMHEITAHEITDKAKAGDPVAQEVIDTTGSLIGKALSYAVNLLNLQMIVLGGGVMESFDQFYPSMEHSFQQHLFRAANPSVQITKSALGYHAPLIGAASLTAQ
jgi:glucokinase